MTECKICGKKFEFLRPHLKVHKLSFGEYQAMFPGQKISSYFESMVSAKNQNIITAKRVKVPGQMPIWR